MSVAVRTPREGVDTSRFILRPLAIGDEALYSGIYCDPATMRYVGPPLSTMEAERSFRAAVRQSSGPQAEVRFMTVVYKASGEALGICGAHLGMPRLGSVEVGIMLLTDARQQGLSHDAFGSFINYLFQSEACEQVWVRYGTNHSAVGRMMIGLSFGLDEQLMPDDNGGLWRKASVSRTTWQSFVNSSNRG